MEQNPSWEANSRLLIQEIPRLLWKPSSQQLANGLCPESDQSIQQLPTIFS